MKLAGLDITIESVPTLGGSPARVTIYEPKVRATIRLASDHFSGFDNETKIFVVLHELGHAVLNIGGTDEDEETVDRWAFKQYCKTNLELPGAVYAVSNVIDPCNNPAHARRTILQFNRANQVAMLRGKITWEQYLKNQKRL